ncbi:hydrogenase maturation protease [Flavilitoribacter nigricans DSM 23189 = NBRC 102662]|uniref:Hydrogenase maturation protease n=2 Tax=Flavilitoribacter TaxID=2762562 RepID=A0A2D0N5U4_FLAN2|nr:hydrogenase maturation protease [Flavilitoribacter nigricans DSM 23189 = NBRC 102662]
MVKKTAVLGFGNPVRADDGVGIYVIEQLQAAMPPDESVSVFDMGTSAFEVLFQLRGHDRIILVDAVINSEEAVGSVFKLPASEVEGKIEDDPLVFLHGLKWHQALSYARKMLGADYPEEIDVYLIAIENTSFNVGMGEAAKQGGDRVVQLLLDEFSG